MDKNHNQAKEINNLIIARFKMLKDIFLLALLLNPLKAKQPEVRVHLRVRAVQ
jgi:hypothetical protein